MKSLLLFFIAFLFLASCDQKTQNSVAADSLAASTTADTGTSVSSDVVSLQSPPEKTVAYYSGVISKNLKIEATLYYFGDSVTGKYKYKTQTSFLNVKGIKRNGILEFLEYDPQGNNTGFFKSENFNDKTISGIWSTSDGKRTFPFTLNLLLDQTSTGDAEISSVEITLMDKGCPCSKVLVPKVTGKLYPEKADAINKLLSFESLSGSKPEEACFCEKESGINSGIVSGGYSIHYNKNMILSVQWCGETVAAYPSGFCDHMNLNLNTGTKITLTDILTEAGISYVIKSATAEMKARLKSISEDPEMEAEAKEYVQNAYENFDLTKEEISDFSFSDSGIIFHVEPGFQHFIEAYAPSGDITISYEKLKSYSAENSVLKQVQ